MPQHHTRSFWLRWSTCAALALSALNMARSDGGGTHQILVPIGPAANTRLEYGSPMGFGAPLAQGVDHFTLNEIPFLHPSGNYAWHSDIAAPTGGPATLRLDLDEAVGPPHAPPRAFIDVFTQLNSYWGTTQPSAVIRFRFDNGAVQEHPIHGNTHIRDYHRGGWTQEISSSNSAQGIVWGCVDSTAQFRMDTQRWQVTFTGSERLTAIEFIDNGAPQLSRLVVGGVTIITEYSFDWNCMYPSWPDGCHPCPYDFDGDEVVDAADMGFVLANWGATQVDECSPSPIGDADRSGVVDASDLGALLSSWGGCPE